MARTLFFLALIIAAASAFVQPSNMAVTRPAFAPKVEAPQMMVDSAQLTDIANNAQLIATSSDDFGGAFFPIIGLGAIAAFILFLSPPLADVEYWCIFGKHIRASIVTGTLCVGVLTSTSCEQVSHASEIRSTIKPQWLLPNGEVKIVDPLTLFPNQSLTAPKFLGSGGGGAVFAVQRSDTVSESTTNTNSEVALKISWVSSAASVEKECKILQILEENNARNVEHCLGKVQYPDDPRRVMIELEPVVNDATAIVSEVDRNKQASSVGSIISTLVDMLAANIVTTDVQVLMNKRTGEVTFIDMTEAQVMSNPPSFLDIAQASSFCSEIFALIPENLMNTALDALTKELDSNIMFSDNSLRSILEARLQ